MKIFQKCTSFVSGITHLARLVPILSENVINGPWKVFMKKKSTKVHHESSNDILSPWIAIFKDWRLWSLKFLKLAEKVSECLYLEINQQRPLGIQQLTIKALEIILVSFPDLVPEYSANTCLVLGLSKLLN